MSTRRAWEIANRKYVVEDDATFAIAIADGDGTLLPVERELLAPLLAADPFVVHLQSGNATDDFSLCALGASFVVGVDFSGTAALAAAGRAARAGLPAGYVTADATQVALADGCADLVYTGKGSLVWLPDLDRWASEVHRLLRDGGALFVYDAHPISSLWTLDPDRAAIDDTVDYFGGTRPNTSFPATAVARFADGDAPDAIEQQWSLAAILSALLRAGLVVEHLGEHPEPFWRPTDGSSPAAAWNGKLPNSVSILARRPAGPSYPSGSAPV